MKLKKIMGKCICCLLSFIIIFAYALSASPLIAKADVTTIKVVVDGTQGQIASGVTEQHNALEAMKDVLDSKGIKYSVPDGQYGKFIDSIGDLKTNDVQKGSGWMYAIKKSDGTYVSPDNSIDNTNLDSMDELLVYFSLWGTTYLANDIEFSTKQANKPVTISINNKSLDWNTNQTVTTPIENITAKVISENGDEVPVSLDKNTINISGGLKEGNYYLDLSDYSNTSIPKVAADRFEFNITKEDTTSNGNGQGNTQNGNGDNNSNSNFNIENEMKLTENVVKNYTDEWAALDFYKTGMQGSINKQFITDALNNINKNGISKYYNTQIEKLIIGLTAAGYTPYNFAGINLVSELYNRNIDDFLVNDAIYGLMAYNFANINDENYKIKKDTLKNYILQNAIKDDNGNVAGWSYDASTKTADADMTGATISALSTYYNSGDKEVISAVDSAIKHLNDIENDSGYIPGTYGDSSETNAFAIIGLLSVNVDPYGTTKISSGEVNFQKPKGNLVSALLSYKTSDGHYKHNLQDEEGNDFSTEEAFRALFSLNEFSKSKGVYNYYESNINAAQLPVYNVAISSGASNTNTNVNNSKNVSENQVLKGSTDFRGTLPKTGYFFDFKLLFIMGIALMAIGFCIIGILQKRAYILIQIKKIIGYISKGRKGSY